MLVSKVRPEFSMFFRAFLGAAVASWMTSLLPDRDGYWGTVLPGVYYLLLLSLFWSLLRVVGRSDLLWLLDLFGNHRRQKS